MVAEIAGLAKRCRSWVAEQVAVEQAERDRKRQARRDRQELRRLRQACLAEGADSTKSANFSVCGMKATLSAYKPFYRECSLTDKLLVTLSDSRFRECDECGLPYVGTRAYCDSCLGKVATEV